MLDVGQPAPDFSLVDHNSRHVTLSEFRGMSNVVLSFFVFAFFLFSCALRLFYSLSKISLNERMTFLF